jgi:hypothetical protein
MNNVSRQRLLIALLAATAIAPVGPARAEP